MEAVDTDKQYEDFQQLHKLIAESKDIQDFLDGMVQHAALTLSRTTGATVACTITLHRHKCTVTVSGSNGTALALDRIEQDLGSGPCLEAARTSTTVVLADTRNDPRWPLYSRGLDAAGYRTVLGVPVDLGENAAASLNFFGPAAGLFSDEALCDAIVFTHTAGQALRLALRIITAELLAEDLKAAMRSRTDIDIACGMIMTQNRCTQEEAYQFLLRASNHRNMKLHTVAEQIILRLSGTKEIVTHFDE
jgi:GAF domain-containing protein